MQLCLRLWAADWCLLSPTLNSERSFRLQEGEPVLFPGQVLSLAAAFIIIFFLSLGLGKGNKALCGSQVQGSQTLPPLCVWKPFSGFPARCATALQGTFAQRGWETGSLPPEPEEPREQRAPTVLPCQGLQIPDHQNLGSRHHPLGAFAAIPALRLAVTVSLNYAPDQL